jgi:hypothetical protein
MQLHQLHWNCTKAAVRQQVMLKFVLCDALHVQDGNNINNTMTVLPRDANDSGVRERLLSPKGMWLRCSSVAWSVWCVLMWCCVHLALANRSTWVCVQS